MLKINKGPSAFVVCSLIFCLSLAKSSIATAQQVVDTGTIAEEPQGSMHVIRFPTDRSIGTVLIQDMDTKRQIETFFYWVTQEDSSWQFLSIAMGDVSVPAGKRLRLTIRGEAVRKDSSALSKLRPDDIYSLTVHGTAAGPELADECMPYIAGWTGLKVLDLTGARLSIKGIAFIKKISSLERLNLPAQISNEGLAEIARLTSLKGLYFSENRVTDAGLACLAGLTSLEELALGGNNITDAGLAHLANLPRLRYLWLWGNFTNAGLAHLENVPSLKILHAGQQQRITDAGLAHLAQMPNLENVTLHWVTGITDQGIAQLKNAPSLKKLDIGKSQVTDAGLAHLSQIKSLEWLDLPEKGITDEGLHHLAQLKALKYLDMPRMYSADMDKGYTDKGLEEIARLQSLEELRIGSRGITDAGIGQIAKLSNLKELSLFGCTEITNQGLARLGELKNLRILYLHCPKITIAGLASLNAIPTLVELNIGDVQQDNSGLDISKLTKLERLFLSTQARRVGDKIVRDPVRDQDLRCLANLRNLKNFQIGNEGQITDAGMAHLAGLTNLEILIISGPDLTDDGLKFLANMSKLSMVIIYGGKFTDKGLRHLETLKSLAGIELRGENSVTQAGLERLRSKLPNLSRLEIM